MMSVPLSLGDDSCESLIEAVKDVFTDCGISHNMTTSDHYHSRQDFDNHESEVREKIQQRARSKCCFSDY